jgi:phenylpropionate dioxygenase-like ring-hydroxylating dioxygenase large terminal subunit
MRGISTIGAIVAAGLLVVAAWVHGASTQRWRLSPAQAERVARLHALEIRFADWRPTLLTTEELPPHERSRATARHYGPAHSGEGAVVTLISGPPGAVTIHTPDVCYPASGYRVLSGPRRQTITLPDGTAAAYYVADFEKRSATQRERVRVRWSWSSSGIWSAPDRPRWQFARQLQLAPVLFKLYVATPLAEDEQASQREDDETIQAFTQAVLSQYAAALSRP